MTVRVKLCGLTRPQDVVTAMQAGATYVGFVLAPSRRQVTVEQVQTMLAPITTDADEEQARPAPVLVFVDATMQEILQSTTATGARIVQLCGHETPEMCRNLREHGLKVWKAWGVRGTADDEPLRSYVDDVDAVLLDRFHAGTRGGTGTRFSWDAIARIKAWLPTMPLIIAGGLTVDSVGDLLRTHQPFAVDVSSGIETDGIKDPEKMLRFVKQVRSVTNVPR